MVRIDPTGADWIQDRYGSFLWDNNATNQETTRYGWIYIGAELPENVNPYRILEEINGKLYHKSTQNLLASLINTLVGEKLLVEKKAYSPEDDQMMQQFIETGADLTIGAGIGKAVGLDGKAFKGGSKVGKGYSSFAAFKKAEGAAGDGMAWHHIVEQNADNIAKFGAEKIHNTKNLIKLPHGKGSIHAKVSGYYSSIYQNTGMRVRDYVNTLSYDEQYKFGIEILKRFGWKP